MVQPKSHIFHFEQQHQTKNKNNHKRNKKKCIAYVHNNENTHSAKGVLQTPCGNKIK